MSEIHKCSNGRLLLISREDEVLQALAVNSVFPAVVLLMAWTQESVNSAQSLIQRLLQLGCKYFVCAGRYAEDMHDFIDQLIEDANNQPTNVITTYHNDESAELVANFFVNATDVSDIDSDGLVAILNEDLTEEALFREELLNL